MNHASGESKHRVTRVNTGLGTCDLRPSDSIGIRTVLIKNCRFGVSTKDPATDRPRPSTSETAQCPGPSSPGSSRRDAAFLMAKMLFRLAVTFIVAGLEAANREAGRGSVRGGLPCLFCLLASLDVVFSLSLSSLELCGACCGRQKCLSGFKLRQKCSRSTRTWPESLDVY